MREVLVRYRVKPDRVAENEELVRGVYEALESTEPGNFHYATFLLDDGISFVHIAVHDGENPLPSLPAFRRFQENLRDRCDEAPVASEVRRIGSYRFAGSEPA
jgi:Antibiotic biosynthesis monooxygenase